MSTKSATSLVPTGGGDPIRRATRRLRVIHDGLDREIQRGLAKNDLGSKVRCKEGCAHCCYLMVEVTSLEALAMIEAHIHRWGYDHFEIMVWPRIERALRFLNDSAEPSTSEYFESQISEYFESQMPCPFLETGSQRPYCNVYEARPGSCRHLLVISDPSNCAPPSGKSVEKVDLRSAEYLSIGRQGEAARELGIEIEMGPMPLMIDRVARAIGRAPDEAWIAEIRRRIGAGKVGP
jgi:Fe-S-cluster containining protein